MQYLKYALFDPSTESNRRLFDLLFEIFEYSHTPIIDTSSCSLDIQSQILESASTSVFFFFCIHVHTCNEHKHIDNLSLKLKDSSCGSFTSWNYRLFCGGYFVLLHVAEDKLAKDLLQGIKYNYQVVTTELKITVQWSILPASFKRNYLLTTTV